MPPPAVFSKLLFARCGACSLALPALLAGSLGCRQIVGVEDRRSEAAPPGVSCGNVPVPEGACGACLEGECCGELTACSNELQCVDLASCEASCAPSDRSCEAACIAGIRDFGSIDGVAACAFERCAEPCNATCGGWSYRLPTCAPCVQSKCCSRATTCALDPVCRSAASCVQAAGPGAWGRKNACYAAEPYASVLDEIRLRLCIQSECAVACGSGRSWDCVGSITAPRVESSRIGFDVTFSGSIGGPALAGVPVRACKELSDPCEVLKEVTTDGDGRAVFELPVPPKGFNGYLQLEPPDYVPAVLFWVPPLTGNPDSSAWGLLTWAQLDGLSAAIGVPQDLTLGMIVAKVLDCADDAALGVMLEVSDTTANVMYSRMDAPSVSADRTDASGAVLVANVRPGLPDVTVVNPDSGKRLAQVAVPVRSGTITLVSLSPTE